MKTSEFKKKIEAFGFKVTERSNVFDIHDGYGVRYASINRMYSESLSLNTGRLYLIKLCLEYAETPIEEREEEKKYTVVLPDPKNGYDVKYMLTKQNGEVAILRAHRCHLKPLTEAEIKRNHEYLWQFAKEVEE